jgi:hypothetical protein
MGEEGRGGGVEALLGWRFDVTCYSGGAHWSWAAGGPMAHLSNKNSIALWAGLVQVNNFPNNIRRLAHSSHEDCRCVAPPLQQGHVSVLVP